MVFQQLVLNSFRKLRRGSLEVVLPDGSTRHFGGLFRGLRATLVVKSNNVWKRCVLFGAIGFAEGYIAGEWDSPDLVQLIAFFALNSEDNPATASHEKKSGGLFDLLGAANKLLHKARPNSLKKARENIHEHYDLSNEFFRLWLDETMTYSAGFFAPPDLSLRDAQAKKYDMLCRKLELKPQDHLLEIGTGWGGMCIHAAKTTGCRVTSVTISEEQFREATARVEAAGLSDRIEILLLDYRLIEGQFDKIVSIEMVEAVGDRYLDEFFGTCERLLRPRGIFAIQMITCPDRQFPILRDGVDFIQKHIFPGSLLVSQRRVNEAMVRTGDLNLHHWEDMGMHYARTLQIWRENFEANLEKIRGLGFPEDFERKWRYYLCYCEAGFAARHISVVQAVYTRPNNHDLLSPAYTFLKPS